MSSQTNEIKERLSIVDVISSYLKLEPAGKNYKAKCPFHNEKTASFFVSPDRNSYYCFGCHAKGDIFTFVENFEGVDFYGALKILADRAGVVLEKQSTEKKDEFSKLYSIMEEATNYYESSLLKEHKDYLSKRGVEDETLNDFRLGYSPDAWRSVSDYLIEKGFKVDDLEKVGLIKKSRSGFYDRFRNRIIFPITDSSGRVIAFSGRTLDPKENAKYLNSPDTVLFNKSNILFGIDKAKKDIRKRGYSIIVEGQMDLILSHQAGFTNTVAVSGTALTETTSNESKINNLGLVKRLSSNVIFAFDGDESGIRAVSRSGMIAFSLDMQVKVAFLPLGKDPADIILENVDQWKNIIKNSKNIISFHLDRICDQTSDLRLRGQEIRKIIFPFLSLLISSIEKSSYITEIYNKTGISEEALIKDLQNYKSLETETRELESIKANKISRLDLLLKRFFGILFYKKIKGIDELVEELSKVIGSDKFKKLKDKYQMIDDQLSFESEMWYGDNKDNLLLSLEEIVLNIEEEILQEKLFSLITKVDKNKEALKEYQKIIIRIQEIKNSRAK
ncbi:MAG: DNA primase [Patescibacteria group bacterium]|nr:DNA primase [Patescibacteria group bacterium]